MIFFNCYFFFTFLAIFFALTFLGFGFEHLQALGFYQRAKFSVLQFNWLLSH